RQMVGTVTPLRADISVTTPNTENGKVLRGRPPKRRINADVRSREHLTPDEVKRLVTAARKVGRHGHRETSLLMIAYRHGLRVSELVSLRWDQVDLKAGLLHVRRLKNGTPSTHPLRSPELRALRRLRRENDGVAYVFMSERGSPITSASVRKLVQRAGE